MSDITSQVPPAPLPETRPTLDEFESRRPGRPGLRLWPGLAVVLLTWLGITVPGRVAPGTFFQFLGMFWGPMIGAALFAVWWLFASRVRWADGFLGLLACAGVGAAAFRFCHPSVGMLVLIIYALPMVMTGWVVWLLATPFLRWSVRRAGLLLVFVLVWGYFGLVRLEGVDGSFSATFAYRWTPTAEDRFLAEGGGADRRAEPASGSQVVSLQPGDWPGFRGPDRDGRLAGVRIATDWKERPPRLVWRHRVGPGWSSFAAVGDRLYTQEQRGDEEAVVCYDAGSGAEVWAHRDPARFTEAVSGAGPRATPTFHDGRVYSLGGAGQLNCLDAATGRGVWARDLVADSGAKVPTWGFAASPLVARGVVTVFAGAPGGKSVMAYHAASGEPAWSAGEGELSYCSTQPARVGGVEQVVIATDAGLTGFEPVAGKVLWQHPWPAPQLARIVQPAQVGDADFLIGTGFGVGTRRVHVRRDGSGWAADEVWTTRAIRPYFNDLVVHGGHLYGFDSAFFTCVSLEDGKGKWKERGYGNGQVLLLADQGLLLVLSEQGEVALVEANPERRKELGRFRALEGKTWNHPVVAHGRLFVRNGEEAACYEMTPE